MGDGSLEKIFNFFCEGSGGCLSLSLREPGECLGEERKKKQFWVVLSWFFSGKKINVKINVSFLGNKTLLCSSLGSSP